MAQRPLNDVAKRGLALARQIKPMLAGHEASEIGIVLGELTSVWLAGHVVPGDRKATDDHRATELARLVKLILDVTPETEREMGIDKLIDGKGVLQ